MAGVLAIGAAFLAWRRNPHGGGATGFAGKSTVGHYSPQQQMMQRQQQQQQMMMMMQRRA
jgi:hypothetical protein